MTRAVILFCSALAAQELAPKSAPAPGVAAKLPQARMLTLAAPSAAESQPKADARVPQAGFHRKLKANALKTGKWEKGSAALWRMAIRSPGAQALRLHFTGVKLESGKLWVHDGQGHGFGPYTGKGPLGDGDFWSDIVTGDTITMEFQPTVKKTSALPFQVGELSHMMTR